MRRPAAPARKSKLRLISLGLCCSDGDRIEVLGVGCAGQAYLPIFCWHATQTGELAKDCGQLLNASFPAWGWSPHIVGGSGASFAKLSWSQHLGRIQHVHARDHWSCDTVWDTASDPMNAVCPRREHRSGRQARTSGGSSLYPPRPAVPAAALVAYLTLRRESSLRCCT